MTQPSRGKLGVRTCFLPTILPCCHSSQTTALAARFPRTDGVRPCLGVLLAVLRSTLCVRTAKIVPSAKLRGTGADGIPNAPEQSSESYVVKDFLGLDLIQNLLILNSPCVASPPSGPGRLAMLVLRQRPGVAALGVVHVREAAVHGVLRQLLLQHAQRRYQHLLVPGEREDALLRSGALPRGGVSLLRGAGSAFTKQITCKRYIAQ